MVVAVRRGLQDGVCRAVLAVCFAALAGAALAACGDGSQSEDPAGAVVQSPVAAVVTLVPVHTGTAAPVAAPTAIPSPAPAPASTPIPQTAAAPSSAAAPTVSPTLEPASTPLPTQGAVNTSPSGFGKLLAIYMVGSDLEENDESGTDDLYELIEGYESLPDDHAVEVVVAFGGADKDGWRGMKFADIYQIMDDAEDGRFGNETFPGAYLGQYDDANMDDESSLTLFLDYLTDEYAGLESRFLTFWDHGNAYKGFGGDTNFGGPETSAMYMDEMAGAFRQSEPGVFDLIGFDACFMASVEVAKVVSPYGRYMIASEELEPGHGWLWSEVIQIYAREDSAVEAGKGMVDNFVQDVHEGGRRFDGRTLSLVDLGRYEELVTALDPVVAALGQQLSFRDEYSGDVATGIAGVGAFGESERRGQPPTSIDLMDFAQSMSEEFAGTEIEPSLDELLDEIDRFVVHSRHDGSTPHANGISIAAPGDTDPDYSAYKLNAWLDFQEAYADFRASDTASPTVVQQTSDSTGTTAVFTDEYLAEVAAVYGFVDQVEYDDGTVDEVLMVVAEIEAQPTGVEGEYFIRGWDRWWFTVEYDPNEITAWIPASFSDRFEDEYGEYSVYTAEIDFYPAGEDDPKFANLTLLVDGDMQVFDHSIQTYQYIYSGPDDETGTIRFDKATYQIAAGDAVQFWNYGLNLYDAASDDWFRASDIVTFVQEPVFQREILEFADEFGQPIEYYYTLWAQDVNGNEILTELAPAGR